MNHDLDLFNKKTNIYDFLTWSKLYEHLLSDFSPFGRRKQKKSINAVGNVSRAWRTIEVAERMVTIKGRHVFGHRKDAMDRRYVVLPRVLWLMYGQYMVDIGLIYG